MRKRETDRDVFEYDLLGAEDVRAVQPQTREAMRQVVEHFTAFMVEIDKTIDTNQQFPLLA